jgi:stage V sporulation protein S
MGGDAVEFVKVSATSNPKSVAGALAGIVRGSGTVEVQAIGAKAVNQAVKAIAIARGFMGAEGVDLVAAPGFVELELGGEKRTAIRFQVVQRGCRPSGGVAD